MQYTTKELKQLLKANDLKPQWIENHIRTRTEYVPNPNYNPDADLWKPEARRFTEKQIPITHGYIFSDWWIGVQIKYRGYMHFMWFHGWNTQGQPVTWSLDHIWNPGPGKKVRSDGEDNLRRKLEEKAQIKYYARPVAEVDHREGHGWEVRSEDGILEYGFDNIHEAYNYAFEHGYRLE